MTGAWNWRFRKYECRDGRLGAVGHTRPGLEDWGLGGTLGRRHQLLQWGYRRKEGVPAKAIVSPR